MENNARLNEILKTLNDDRSKLSALFSLYNASLLTAENNRTELLNYFEQMIDLKNDIAMLTTQISGTKKTERADALKKNKLKINTIDKGLTEASSNFVATCANYRIALKECGSLKTEYKHEVNELRKEFKSLVNENTPAIIIKGYNQQVGMIKKILDRIETLIADYNIKKNKIDLDSERFNQIYESANTLLNQLKSIA